MQTDILHPDQNLVEKKFTFVASIDVIEHFQRDDGEEIIKTCRDLLDPGGLLILGTPSRFSSPYRSEASRQGHLYEFEPDELRSLCGRYFARTLVFSMNDEVVHTGYNKLAWFFFVIAFKA